MRNYQNIIIGFGKGGKTLAGALAKAGQTVAMVEKSNKMYGGTCINVACIPTKYLENQARSTEAAGGSFEERSERYRKAIEGKRTLTSGLRQKNFEKLDVLANVDILTGTGSFTDSHHVQVVMEDGTTEVLEGERIFINTGSYPFIPPIAGLTESRFSYTSESMMEMEELPRRLLIIGGGYIGLEFASIFRNFGSEVTIIQDGPRFLPRDDEEVAAAVKKSLEERGVRIITGAKITEVKDLEHAAVIRAEVDGAVYEAEGEAILVATGRRPNVQGLNLEAAGVKLTGRGEIETDAGLRTSVPHIWAMGDVKGGLQFTYISLDDFRIVKSQILGDGDRTVMNRGQVAFSVFVDPPFSRIGLSEAEAVAAGYKVKVGRLVVGTMPRAKLLGRTTGLMKAVVDAKTGLVLGAQLFCSEAQELINMIKLAMDAKLPYTVLRDGIYTHPTMSEGMNDLFAI